MVFKKKKKNAIKYTATPELSLPTDGNPGANPTITPTAAPTPEPKPAPPPPEPEPPKEPELTELEISGYASFKTLAFLAELLSTQTQILNVLKEIRDEGDED